MMQLIADMPTTYRGRPINERTCSYCRGKTCGEKQDLKICHNCGAIEDDPVVDWTYHYVAKENEEQRLPEYDYQYSHVMLMYIGKRKT